MRRILGVLLAVGAAQAAQPTMTSIAVLAGVEDQPVVISYAALAAAADESADTMRFKVTILNDGLMQHRPAGSSESWTDVAVGWFFTSNDEVRWMPVANSNGPQTPCALRANNGVGDTLSDNSRGDISLFVNLSPVLDLPTAHSAANRRTAATARLVTVTEDTWTEFTYANLTTLTQAADADGDAITFVLTAVGDGTLARSSGGTPLAAGATIASGESLWWLPSPDTYTKQGETAAADEPPVVLARLRARKTQGGNTYASDEVSLASTIDGVADPFDQTITGCDVIDVVRSTYVEMSTQQWIAHIHGFDNRDRNARIEVRFREDASAGWSMYIYGPDHEYIDSLRGPTGDFLWAADGWYLRLVPPTALGSGTATYPIGSISVMAPGSTLQSTSSELNLRVTEPSDSSTNTSAEGRSSNGCGAGALGAVLFAMLIGVLLRR